MTSCALYVMDLQSECRVGAAYQIKRVLNVCTPTPRGTTPAQVLGLDQWQGMYP